MSHAVRPIALNGLTTAVNATVSSTSTALALTSNTIMVSVGTIAASAFPIYIMFGVANQASTLTSSTGFRLPAGAVLRMDVPSGATTLYHLRAAATDSDISVQPCEGGL